MYEREIDRTCAPAVDPCMNISSKMGMTLETMDKVIAMLNEIYFRLNGQPVEKREAKPCSCMIEAVDGLIGRSEIAAMTADKILGML